MMLNVFSADRKESEVKQRILTITNPGGIHMRVAAEIVSRTKKYQSRIVLSRDGRSAPGESILQLLLLEAVQGEELKIVAAGEDEERAIEELSGLFSNGGGI